MKVKICGITNLEDALVALDAGADFLGFIFYPTSKRAVTLPVARQIATHLKDLPRCPMLVGVFVNESAEQMAAVLDTCSLDLAQLSGDEPPALIGDPASPVYGRSFKALQPTTFAEAEADAEWYAPPQLTPGQPALLLDAYHPTMHGGTGRTVDWQLAVRLAATVPGMMLAGGLTPENVAEAVRLVQPFAVDVASGVERAPGQKDSEKVRRFVALAKGATVA